MTTIPQNSELLKHLFELVQKYRPIVKQVRVVAPVMAEIMVFARHTITQMR